MYYMLVDRDTNLAFSGWNVHPSFDFDNRIRGSFDSPEWVSIDKLGIFTAAILSAWVIEGHVTRLRDCGFPNVEKVEVNI